MNANYNLQLYPLPATIRAYLDRANATAERFAATGATVPAAIGIKHDDFAIVDTIVRKVTKNKVNAHRVTWNGRQLVPVTF